MSSLNFSRQAQGHYHLADRLEGADAILACKTKEMKHVAPTRCRPSVSGTFSPPSQSRSYNIFRFRCLLNLSNGASPNQRRQCSVRILYAPDIYSALESSPAARPWTTLPILSNRDQGRGTIPRVLGRIPSDDATQMRADGRALV